MRNRLKYEKFGSTCSKDYSYNGVVYRICNVCGKELEATLENFSPQVLKSRNWSGLRPDCKSCRNEKARNKLRKLRGN